MKARNFSNIANLQPMGDFTDLLASAGDFLDTSLGTALLNIGTSVGKLELTNVLGSSGNTTTATPGTVLASKNPAQSVINPTQLSPIPVAPAASANNYIVPAAIIGGALLLGFVLMRK